MNKTFEQEWNLYKAGGKRPSFAGEAPRGDAEFDSPVNVGESVYVAGLDHLETDGLRLLS